MRHLKYLNKFFWKYRKLLIVGTFFIAIANLFALYPAEFVRKAFDAVILGTNNNIENTINVSAVLLKYGSLIVLFAILKGVFMYFMRQTIIVMSRKIEFDLKNEIYTQYQNLSISFYKKNKTDLRLYFVSLILNFLLIYSFYLFTSVPIEFHLKVSIERVLFEVLGIYIISIVIFINVYSKKIFKI